MGLLDSILGRSRPVRPDLDRLFALPAAALTLQAGTGYAPTGAGSVCFAGVEGGAFTQLKEEVRELLDVDADADMGGDADADGGADAHGSGSATGSRVAFTRDTYGYTWLAAHRPADDLVALVNDLHAVNTLLEEAGFGPHLLCSLTAFRDPDAAHDLALVYLYKRGTFYPFAPRSDGSENRDNTLELQVRALLAGDLAMEPELERWFPVWGAPGLGGS
ncbi:PspA-associated protein PspAB [Streptomyces sp. NPDC003943]